MSDPSIVPEHLLGDHRDPTWGDMSSYVVHFTENPAVFAKIIATGVLLASGPFGFSWARKVDEVKALHSSVCFSEVPLDKVERLMRRHGLYGIAFKKSFIRANGGARVWYIDQGSEQARSLNDHLLALNARGDFDNPIWRISPFVDLVMPGRYEWDWEREWRIQGNLSFDLEDVAFVITPEGFDELPAFEGIYMHHWGDRVISATPSSLAEYLEDLVQQFFQTFEDPVSSLPVDGGGYVWIVEEWTTESAVAEVFPQLLEEVHEQLLSYLNGISWSWVLSEDLASLYE